MLLKASSNWKVKFGRICRKWIEDETDDLPTQKEDERREELLILVLVYSLDLETKYQVNNLI